MPKSTLWTWVIRGRLPAEQVGRTFVIRRADLEAFRAEHLAGTVQRRRGWVHGWKE